MMHPNSPLPSWTDGDARHAITSFVERVSDQASPDFIPPDDRVAVFDNDGTLWCEKPVPAEIGFILHRLRAMAEVEPGLRDRQPWKAAWDRDYGWLGSIVTRHYRGDDGGVRVLMRGILEAFDGMHVEEYEAAAGDFLHHARNPQLERGYLDTAYTPMIELLRYLEANRFTTYIASGGDRDFMRTIADELYGIPDERVIGSSNALRYRSDEHGGWVEYESLPDVFDDGPVKPVRIWSRIGRRPVFAVGNSNGDIPMLEFTAHPSRPSFAALVKHDDGDREIAYVEGAEKVLELAQSRDWTVIRVKDDWNTVFPH